MVDRDVWREFVEFIGRAPAAQHPGVLFEGFRRDRLDAGATPEEAERQVQYVIEQARTRDDWAAPMFDRIYSSDAPLFSRQPNGFVARMATEMPAGRALDVAMGEGRNALHLATLGWDVTGFDVSPEGLRAARDAAAAAGTEVHTVLASGDTFEYGIEAWDLIVITYALVPVSSADFAATIAAALRPGGRVVIESFAVEGDRPVRPVDVDPDALRAAYGGLRELAFEVEESTADWTLESALIVRLAAGR